MTHRRRRTGLTLTDVVICLAMAVLLAAVALPAVRQAQEDQKRKTCADNLRMISQAAMMYANSDRAGRFPRTYYDGSKNVSPTQYTGVDAPKSFAAGAPGASDVQANDVTAGFYLILKTQEITPDRFVCPGGTAKPLAFPSGGIKDRSNFPSRRHLGYSYANPYPHQTALQTGWRFSMVSGPETPLAADMNPGGNRVQTTAPDAGAEAMKRANSPNHGGAGQNVVYCDGHVEFQPTPYCGAARLAGEMPGRDNIYTVGAGVKGAPGGTAVKGPPTDAQDMVLLPVMADGDQPDDTAVAQPVAAGAGGPADAAPGAVAAGGKATGTKSGVQVPWTLVIIGGGILVLGAAAGVAMMLMKKKPQAPRRY